MELGVKAFYFESCSLSFRAFTLLSGMVGEGSLVLSSYIDYIYAHTHTHTCFCLLEQVTRSLRNTPVCLVVPTDDDVGVDPIRSSFSGPPQKRPWAS